MRLNEFNAPRANLNEAGPAVLAIPVGLATMEGLALAMGFTGAAALAIHIQANPGQYNRSMRYMGQTYTDLANWVQGNDGKVITDAPAGQLSQLGIETKQALQTQPIVIRNMVSAQSQEIIDQVNKDADEAQAMIAQWSADARAEADGRISDTNLTKMSDAKLIAIGTAYAQQQADLQATELSDKRLIAIGTAYAQQQADARREADDDAAMAPPVLNRSSAKPKETPPQVEPEGPPRPITPPRPANNPDGPIPIRRPVPDSRPNTKPPGGLPKPANEPVKPEVKPEFKPDSRPNTKPPGGLPKPANNPDGPIPIRRPVPDSRPNTDAPGKPVQPDPESNPVIDQPAKPDSRPNTDAPGKPVQPDPESNPVIDQPAKPDSRPNTDAPGQPITPPVTLPVTIPVTALAPRTARVTKGGGKKGGKLPKIAKPKERTGKMMQFSPINIRDPLNLKRWG
jgi:hypothetical protein